MKKQQEMLRDACLAVLGFVPAKGQPSREAFTEEVREKIADFMMPLLGTEWTIKSERTLARAREYITGKQPTDLLQCWTFDPAKKEKSGSGSGPDLTSKIAALKAAVDAGLMTQADAAAIVAGLLK